MTFCRPFSYDWDQGVEVISVVKDEQRQRFWKKFRTPPKIRTS